MYTFDSIPLLTKGCRKVTLLFKPGALYFLLALEEDTEIHTNFKLAYT